MEQLDRHSSGTKTTLEIFIEKRCNLILLDHTKNNIFDGFEINAFSYSIHPYDKGFTEERSGIKKKSRNTFNTAYLVRNWRTTRKP